MIQTTPKSWVCAIARSHFLPLSCGLCEGTIVIGAELQQKQSIQKQSIQKQSIQKQSIQNRAIKTVTAGAVTGDGLISL
jgi:hypothetical protein